jgi:hypothetical protein
VEYFSQTKFSTEINFLAASIFFKKNPLSFFLKKKIVVFAVFYFSCCCGSALFQQQPTGLAEASVFVSEIAVYCYQLHFVSASSSTPDLTKFT